ncbi:BRO1-like domain/ALIX V-shaped domain binding to HIV, putative [Trypanosoma equiperdum]|uniref:BRO1 domain-containing protein n=3 Tax=Trypanozoon TaxID=39700 RepID=Q386T1_TRYB2|nr:hypothetical protein, conserved [Trypanosoma brucei gambiense DAL972]XP_828312.1 hypothetical protein, conserved [Trypanosoma brucei brucei TREU927]EAN79200.1 hypothetical protein, conserved [Trypanosoma brucei brucei TREU927]CBH17136.1 hypothetical protein, conserved [Trypanosoma brucei gambiense DAL972]SCU72907.1 BRO1-like domain/ALIX V-shaped domain binding to HIV, putative [Trypanosoma equiperdum]|eukprot:XP_011779400.1 hypothetical protein, conserved [Trypanosoma brucei gambiense DAL972]
MTTFEHLPDLLPLLPFRRGKKDSVDWTLCIRYISSNFTSNYTSNVESALRQMNSFHHTIVQTCHEDATQAPTESFIEEKLTPYCKLVAMVQSHLPLHGGLVHGDLRFIWYDSFDGTKYESKNANLELLSCVYNLAASWAYIGAQQTRDGLVDKLKVASKAFQNATGYYEMAEGLLSRLPPELATGDLTHESLSLLKRICAAMTHHCAYLKAEIDMKDNHSVLSKIAREGGKVYQIVATSLKESAWYTNSRRGSKAVLLEQELRTLCCVFNARAHLHVAEVHSNANDQGIAVAHFNEAQKHLQQIEKLHSVELRSWISSIISNVNKGNERALSMNNTVYFCRVPNEVEPPAGLPRPLGKATEHQSFFAFESTRENDPLFGIVPAHIASTAAGWRDRQRSLVSACSTSSRSTRKRAAELLQRLGVTAVIEVLSGETKDRGRVPAQLRSKIESLRRNKAGEAVNIVQTLVNMVKICDKIYVSVQEVVKKVKNELEEERRRDAQYMETYGNSMWRGMCCSASEVQQYHSIQVAIGKYEEDLQRELVEPFGQAKIVLDENLKCLGRLDWPMEDLDALMPFTKTEDVRQQSEKVLQQIERLKKLTACIHELEASQNNRLQELEHALETDDVARALSAVEESQYQVVMAKESKKISDMIDGVSSSVRKEEEVLREIEEVVESLAVLRSSDPILEEAEKVCNTLECGCSAYAELHRDFSNIVKKGSAILKGLEVVLSSAKSFVATRKSEAEQIRVSLDEQIAHKIAELEHKKESERAVEESQRRQEELQLQVQLLERQLDPQRSERMAEVLRRQREAAAAFSSTSASLPPSNMSGVDAPPAYDFVVNNVHPNVPTHTHPPQYYAPHNPLS